MDINIIRDTEVKGEGKKEHGVRRIEHESTLSISDIVCLTAETKQTRVDITLRG